MTHQRSGGTYTLLIRLPTALRFTVGALGEKQFRAGWCAYTGSAHGPGGFARVRRHREVSDGTRETRQWHIDYLLGHEQTHLDGIVASAGLDIECSVAATVAGDRISNFGSSDCGCSSHLVWRSERDLLVDAVARAYTAAMAGDR